MSRNDRVPIIAVMDPVEGNGPNNLPVVTWPLKQAADALRLDEAEVLLHPFMEPAQVQLAAVLLLAAMAVLFCQLWVAQIRDFKRLNDAKFDILNRMAPLLAFDSSGATPIYSFRPFERDLTGHRHSAPD